MAEIGTTVQIQIDVSPDLVFRWVTEPSNKIYWMNGVRNAAWIRRQEVEMPRPHDTWGMIYEYGGKENEVIMEVDVCDPRDGAFEFHTIEGPYPIPRRVPLPTIGQRDFVPDDKNRVLR